MEHNKVLMVIVSVAIFFAAVIGVGVALLYPRGNEANLASSDGIVQEFDPIEYVRRSSDAELAPQDDSDQPLVIVYGDSETPDQQSTTNVEPTVGTEVNQDDGDGSRVTITERPARSRGTEEGVSTVTPSDATPRSSGPAVETTRPPQPVPSAVERSQPPSPREIRVTEYWIQLIASPNRDRVEQARGSLADYSLGGRVTTRDVNGEMYYRLRVGPYTSESEAEKFLEWIQDIEGFEGAYVSEEYPLRTVSS